MKNSRCHRRSIPENKKWLITFSESGVSFQHILSQQKERAAFVVPVRIRLMVILNACDFNNLWLNISAMCLGCMQDKFELVLVHPYLHVPCSYNMLAQCDFSHSQNAIICGCEHGLVQNGQGYLSFLKKGITYSLNQQVQQILMNG